MMVDDPKKKVHLEKPLYVYWLDSRDEVVDVNDGDVNYWDQFAFENNGYGALAELVLGRELYGMIAGTDTQFVMGRIVDEVRRTGEPMVECYRCDSPGMKREMEMTAVREKNSLIRFSNRVIRMLPHSVVLNALTLPEDCTGLPESVVASVFIRCSFCQKYQAPDDHRWFEPEHLELTADALSDIMVDYDVCSDCKKQLGV